MLSVQQATTSNLYEHQKSGIRFLEKHSAAMLADEMGLGKSRQALIAAQHLFWDRKIDRVLVLAPAAVRYSWRTELDKLEAEQYKFLPCIYDVKKQLVYGATRHTLHMLPILVLSYSLLPQARHLNAIEQWCARGLTLLICDESSFLKNRAAKQTKATQNIGAACLYKWLLTGTPIANSPLDLWGQGVVMFSGPHGALAGFKNWFHFRSRYAVMGGFKGKVVIGHQNLPELTKRFSPYVLRRTKQECLDLPAKTYEIREVALSAETWRIYQDLKREALLSLPDTDAKPEPNAAVRLLRLCQLTSGHVGAMTDLLNSDKLDNNVTNVSSEKLSWLVEEILGGELSDIQALIVWCRWRRERERLHQMLATKIETYSVFGGQQDKNRSAELGMFSAITKRRVLLAQPHAGGYGLNLTAASTAVYLSNDFSFTTRVQSEDRCHRIGQHNPVLYVDVLATGPKGEKTVDHHVLSCLREKKNLADLTCSAWKKVLSD